MYRLLSACCAFVLTIILSSSALAQGNAELTDKQRELNQQAVEAAIANDFEKSARLLSTSLQLGEANIIYLNLGRAYANLGQCEEALEAYDKVNSSPTVVDPPPKKVAEALIRFKEELPDQCPGKIKFTCKPVAMELSIDGGSYMVCPSGPITADPGRHIVRARYNDQEVERTIEVVALRTVDMELSFDTTRPKDAVAVNPREVAPPERGVQPLTWVLLGGGVALLATGVIIDQVVVAEDVDRLEEAQTGTKQEFDSAKADVETGQAATLALYVTGGVATALGVGFLIYDLTAEPKRTSGPTAWFDGETAGIGWTGRF